MSGTSKRSGSGGGEANGVTIVSPTIRPEYMARLLDNYARQRWENKELIIVLNRESMSLRRYLQAAKPYRNVRVMRLPGACTLGDCLNAAAARARYPFVAKFDDDDYYGPDYLAEAMYTFEKTNADIVGKTSFFFYFPHRRLLLLRERPVRPYEATSRIAGATIMFRKQVLHTVRFGKRRQGSDVQFIRDCLRGGLSVISSSPYNFAAFRRSDRRSHTWKVTERKLLADPSASVFETNQFGPIVDRRWEQPMYAGSRASGAYRLKRNGRR